MNFLINLYISTTTKGTKDNNIITAHSNKLGCCKDKNFAIGFTKTSINSTIVEINIAKYKYQFLACFFEKNDIEEEC